MCLFHRTLFSNYRAVPHLSLGCESQDISRQFDTMMLGALPSNKQTLLHYILICTYKNLCKTRMYQQLLMCNVAIELKWFAWRDCLKCAVMCLFHAVQITQIGPKQYVQRRKQVKNDTANAKQ